MVNYSSPLADPVLDGIESEVRAVQYSVGAQAAASWWQRNFAHKYPEYRYDEVRERIVRRDES